MARERLWQHGVERISDDELVALILGTGMRGKPVWTLASDVVRSAGGLGALSRATPQELVLTSGIGACRAVRLVAAFELGRRALAGQSEARQIRSPEELARLLVPRFAGMVQESFYVIGLDTRNQVVADLEVARGTLCSVEVHPREVFRPLIRASAAAAVLAHNHPSGDPTPSDIDWELTHRLRAVGEMVGIPVIDHVVIAGARYRSLIEWGGSVEPTPG
jgi:DNA repair protein RadC